MNARADLYKPLRARGLLVQIAIVVAAEALLFHLYRVDESDFHWAIHFLVGVTAAAIWNVAWLPSGRPAPGMLLWILPFHLLAMTPDLLYKAFDVPHAEWMEVFLAHISVHYLPGRVAAWLVIALGAWWAYATLLALWLRERARDAEVASI